MLAIWVMFPRLPLQFWGKKCLGRVASLVGKPLRTDECTIKQSKVAYARVMIEVDITQPLLKSVCIKSPVETMIDQVVEYEWAPIFCQKFQVIGHICRTSPPPRRTLDHREQPQQRQGRRNPPVTTQWTEVGRWAVVGAPSTFQAPAHTDPAQQRASNIQQSHNQFTVLQQNDEPMVSVRFGDFGENERVGIHPSPSHSSQ